MQGIHYWLYMTMTYTIVMLKERFSTDVADNYFQIDGRLGMQSKKNDQMQRKKKKEEDGVCILTHDHLPYSSNLVPHYIWCPSSKFCLG